MTVTPPDFTLLDPNDGSITWLGSPVIVPGVTASVGTTRSLDGVDDHGTSSLDPMSSGADDNKDTFTCMVNVDASTGFGTVWGQHDNTATVFDVFVGFIIADGRVFFNRVDQTVKQTIASAGTFPADNTFHHLTLRSSNNGLGMMQIFVDGIEASSYDAQVAFTAGIHTPRNSLVIGAAPNGSSPLTGIVDRMKLWHSYTLTDAEVLEEATNELALLVAPAGGIYQPIIPKIITPIIPKVI